MTVYAGTQDLSGRLFAFESGIRYYDLIKCDFQEQA